MRHRNETKHVYPPSSYHTPDENSLNISIYHPLASQTHLLVIEYFLHEICFLIRGFTFDLFEFVSVLLKIVVKLGGFRGKK
jgi:hypothetical protein